MKCNEGGKVFLDIERLRSPKRLAWLEVERAVDLSLDGLQAQSVLDIGTGSGIFAEAFAGKGPAVTGIDGQEAMIEAARRIVARARFQVAVAEDLPFADGSFTLCFLGLVLHEADGPLQALREACRVCATRTAVLEWPYKEQKMGPPLAHRLQPGQVHAWAKASGFKGVHEVNLATLILYLMEKE